MPDPNRLWIAIPLSNDMAATVVAVNTAEGDGYTILPVLLPKAPPTAPDGALLAWKYVPNVH